jgi:hypothetical protein
MPKIAGSGSINQRHGSADPDPDPDPHQNVMDPQHWFKEWGTVFLLKVGFEGWARYLCAIYLFPRSVHLFCCKVVRKRLDDGF